MARKKSEDVFARDQNMYDGGLLMRVDGCSTGMMGKAHQGDSELRSKVLLESIRQPFYLGCICSQESRFHADLQFARPSRTDRNASSVLLVTFSLRKI